MSSARVLLRHARIAVIAASVILSACATQQSATSADPAPAPAAPSPAPVAVDLKSPPALPAPPALTLPPIASRELPNGLKILVVEHHELPVADFILLVRSGTETDPAEKSGLSTLTASMLDEGTTTRNALQIADQEAFLGVDVSTSSGWDATSVTLHTPTAQLDSALALFADIALRPSFPTTDLERLRKDRLTELLQLKDRAPAIADRAFAAIVYGTGHPYGRPTSGTEATVTSITQNDVRRHYETYFRPNNATLIAVGAVKPDDVARRAQALFGNWQRRDVPQTAYGEAPKAGATTIYLIDKPGAPQSSFRIGMVGVPRSTKDFFALQLMNTVLGGSFTSRLNQNLRETKGYTYGAFSGFSMRRAAGPFTARAEVVAAKSDSALLEFMKELRAIRDTVSAEELTKTKRYLQLQMPSRFETTGDIASQLVPVVLYDLPLDFYNTYVQQIENVTQADVRRVANQYLDPANLAVVIVGDRQSIESGLRGTHVGTVSLRNLEGQTVHP
ncbi:MAG TPA: pitrilysin family protein [Gemmatimonadaceae bacterium]|nr:pitrilysin family protein [Gemmatimonadaceae bacterium]